MTDEEADALDELVTRNPPRVSGDGKSGFFMKHKGNIVILDEPVIETDLEEFTQRARRNKDQEGNLRPSVSVEVHKGGEKGVVVSKLDLTASR
jgi:hypothetical protein